jgi:hypothetical protein
MMAIPPPLRKKLRTAKLRGLRGHSPPKMRSKSVNPFTTFGSFSGPQRVGPRKAVIEVGTPVIVRTPLGISVT